MAAKKIYTQKQLEAALDRIDAVYADFKIELARLKAERIKIVDRINKKADDRKIQDILKRIK